MTKEKTTVHSPEFVRACEQANETLKDRPGYRKVEPTPRQYRKWLRGFGSAYEFGREQK